MAHCDQEIIKGQPSFQPTSDPLKNDEINSDRQEDDHEKATSNKHVTLPYQSPEKDVKGEINSQICTLQHLSELACQIELERKNKDASTSNGNNGHVIRDDNHNNLHKNKNAPNYPNSSDGVDDFALPLWVKWRGKWQTGIRCPRGDCPSLTLNAKPTHDRKTYISVFFPRSKAYSWVDTLLVRPIDDSPVPLVNGTHNKWRKMVNDMNIPRNHAMQKLALAMLNLTENLHSQAVIEDARKTETWKIFAMEASCCKKYAELGEMLVKFCNMILPDYKSSDWVKDSYDSWVQRCRSATCAESFETLMEELVQHVTWQEINKLYNGFMQPELTPEWKTIKQDVTKWFTMSREDAKRPIGDTPVTPESSQISRKRPKLEIRRAGTSSAPQMEHEIAALDRDVSNASSTGNPKGYTYKQCSAFIEAKGRQCERWANDGDIYCCVHLNIRVDACDRRAPVDAPLCRGTTTNGTSCKHRAKPGSDYCKKHNISSPGMITFSNNNNNNNNNNMLQEGATNSAQPSTSVILSPIFGQISNMVDKKPDGYNNNNNNNAIVSLTPMNNMPRANPKPTDLTPISTSSNHALTVVSSSSTVSVPRCIGERTNPDEVFSECHESAKKFDLYCQNHIPKFLKRARDGRSRPITKEVIIKLLKTCSSRHEKLLVHRACELLYIFLKSKLLIRRSRMDSAADQNDLISSAVFKDPEVGRFLLKLISSEREKLASVWGFGSTDFNPNPNPNFNFNPLISGEGSSNQNIIRGLKRCKLCPQEFTDDHKLGLHWRDVHKREARLLFRGYACALCREGFTKRKALELHVQEKHDLVQTVQQLTLFRCMSCNCHFPSPDLLWQHVLSSHVSEFTSTETVPGSNSQKFTCIICGLKFDSLPDLGRHHQLVHLDNKSAAAGGSGGGGGGSASFTHRRGKYQLDRTRHLLNQHMPDFKFKKNQTSVNVKNAIKLTISNQNSVQERAETEPTGLRQLTDNECINVAQSLFSDIHKSKTHPSNSDILSVARLTCCKIKLIAELEAKFGSLPENIYLKAAKLCSEAGTRIEWHQEGFICPKGCKYNANSPVLGPLSPINEPYVQTEEDFGDDEYHAVLDSKHFGWEIKRDGVVFLCGDVSFGKEKIAIPCVLDEEIRDSVQGLDESVADGIFMPWKDFTYVTERIVDPSFSDSKKDKVLGCGCAKERCDQESCDHVYLFDNDYESAVDKCGKPMLGKFAFDERGCIILEEGYPVYECNSSCKCDASCQNRVLQRGINVKLEVFRTKTKGWGVRAVEAIPVGTFICEYIGEVVSGEQAGERRERQSKDGCHYLCDIEAHMGYAGGNCEEPISSAIDARKYGNVARFINHSCSPNLSSYVVLVESMDCQLSHIGLFAKQDINVGEELVFDYRYKARNGVGQPCSCGSPSCRGHIN